MLYPFLLFLFNLITSLDIHVIPHSHMDPGWIKTYDEYYKLQVVKIFNNVYMQLTNPLNTSPSVNNRTFVFCEMINFQKWYTSLDPLRKEQIRRLIKEKRIEFVGGGLVMNDEANSLYQDIIDQLRKGNQFIKEEFNETVNVGWMLDPFGHSEANALIHSQLGFEYLLLNRIDYQEHKYRTFNGKLEFIWKPFNGDKTIFTNILPYHYGTSMYFKFLHEEKEIPSKVKPDKIANTFIKLVKNKMIGYLHNQYMLLLGDDFTFFNSNYLYKRAEFIMNFINNNTNYEHQGIRMFYSTPSKYFAAVQQDLKRLNKTLDVETSTDFFPYADLSYAYWTGYFTSRPYLKGMSKYLSNLHFTSATFLLDMALQNRNEVKDIELNNIQNIIGLLQHHDAITGTAKEKVSNDYIKKGQNVSHETIVKVRNVLKEKKYVLDKENVNICLSNPTIDFGCNNSFRISDSEDNRTVIGVINPGIEGEILITIELKNEVTVYKVFNEKHIEIKSDFYCLDKKVFEYQYNCFLNFFYDFSKDVLVSSFILEKTNMDNVNQFKKYSNAKVAIIEKQNSIQSLIFNPINQTFLLEIYDNEIKNYEFKLYHGYYKGYSKAQNSTIRPKNANPDGAYIFAPTELRPIKFRLNEDKSFYYKGNISTVFMFSYDNSTYMLITIFYSPFIIKVDSIIIPILKTNDKNFILGFNSNLKNNVTIKSIPYNTSNPNQTYSEFWTDSNGIQMKRRIIDHREYEYKLNELIASNFYPVTTKISLREKSTKEYSSQQEDYLNLDDKQITFFTDRPQSGSSLREGEIMLLILRSSLNDDRRGVNEFLFETVSSRSFFKVSHFIMIGHSIYTDNNKLQNRYRSLRMIHNTFYRSPLLFKGTVHNTINSYLNKIFIISDNIFRNVDIISDDFAVVQFYRVYDYYFTMDSKDFGGLLSIRINKKEKLKIEIDMNGINCIDVKKGMMQKEKEKKGFLQLLNEDINVDIYMKRNEFVFVYLYFP